MVRTTAIMMGLCCLMLTSTAQADFKFFGRRAPAGTVTARSQAPVKANMFQRAMAASKRGISATKAFVHRHSWKIMASGAVTTVGGLGMTIYGLGARDPSIVHTGMIVMGAGVATGAAVTYPAVDKLLTATMR